MNQTSVTLTSPAELYVDSFFRSGENQSYKKYDCADSVVLIAKRLASYAVIFSPTAVKRAILELEDEGVIERADGKSKANDVRDMAQVEEDRQRKIAESTPLTPELCSQFAAMSPADVSRQYYKERAFKLLYDRACALWGFRVPEPRA